VQPALADDGTEISRVFLREVSSGSDEYCTLVIAWKKKHDGRINGISSGN
jgi:hypothetical protein